MPKEWIINQANMRWGLNKENKVGAVSEKIRKCSPKSLSGWEEYYYKNVYPKEHLNNLGRTLYVKISEVCQAEIESITEQDCINFVINLVINRTYDGYQSEIQTIYGQLQHILGVKIEPAPDDWDRGYNEFKFQEQTHKKFTKRYGGKVFYIISVADDKKKVIQNTNVIEEIKKEIDRLRQA